jgi:aldehyde dehydrogenase (NAD+)
LAGPSGKQPSRHPVDGRFGGPGADIKPFRPLPASPRSTHDEVLQQRHHIGDGDRQMMQTANRPILRADDRVPPPAAKVLRHLVGGRWRSGAGAVLLDHNPARPSEVVASGRLALPADVDDAVAGARSAYPAWAATPHAARAEVLWRTAEVLSRSADAWGVELAREEGKTRAEAVGEVRRAAEIFRFYAAESTRPIGEVYASPRPAEQIQVVHRPVGTVAVITPFNFPIAIPAWKIAPALSYGNTVVWKPASTVPLLAVRLTEALVQAGLPDGVLSLLFGGGDIGGQLVEHPGIDAVTFTGSTSVGRRLIARCGALARPIQVEMGGKNAAAVLADADLDLAADEVIAGAFKSAGQKCTATSRLIVNDRVADDFLTTLVERSEALRVGDPLHPDTTIGPVITLGARDDIETAVRDGLRRDGARVLAGGRGFRGTDRDEGAYVEPTIVEIERALVGRGALNRERLMHEPPLHQPLWRDELFGPVLTVVRAVDDDEALDLINASRFGLSAAVFTDNLRAMTTAIERVDVGILHINSETAGADPHVPFGGAKESGFGPREQGAAAREFFTTTKTVYLRATRGPRR